MAIQQCIHKGLRELALFAGIGGGILGGKLLGWRTVCAVERDAYAASVLAQRQNDGALEVFPIWSDVCSFDGKPWRGIIDVVSGGFPCQDISVAGKGKGITGEKSSMWFQMARIISEVRPRFVFVENSPMLVSRGLDAVLGSLSQMGYDAQWGIVSAESVGAPHKRERIWIFATDTRSVRCFSGWGNREKRSVLFNKFWHAEKNKQKRIRWKHRFSAISKNVANSTALGLQGGWKKWETTRQAGLCGGSGKNKINGIRKKRYWWEAEPDVGRVVDGCSARVDRLKALGNAQVPLVAATAAVLFKNI